MHPQHGQTICDIIAHLTLFYAIIAAGPVSVTLQFFYCFFNIVIGMHTYSFRRLHTYLWSKGANMLGSNLDQSYPFNILREGTGQ